MEDCAMPTSIRARGAYHALLAAVLAATLTSCGGYSSAGPSNGGGGGGGGTSAPSAPTGLAATPASTQVSLVWNASNGASTYYVKRATMSGGPYTQINAPATTNFTDIGLTNGTTYYYVVSAGNAYG